MTKCQVFDLKDHCLTCISSKTLRGVDTHCITSPIVQCEGRPKTRVHIELDESHAPAADLGKRTFHTPDKYEEYEYSFALTNG